MVYTVQKTQLRMLMLLCYFHLDRAFTVHFENGLEVGWNVMSIFILCTYLGSLTYMHV